jgi:hypothetical protein
LTTLFKPFIQQHNSTTTTTTTSSRVNNGGTDRVRNEFEFFEQNLKKISKDSKKMFRGQTRGRVQLPNGF